MSSSNFVPRESHITKAAKQTTVTLELEDSAAINWIKLARSGRGSDRTRLNDILRDALWYYMEKTEGKTKAEFMANLPPRAEEQATGPANVAQMPKPKKRN